MHRPPRRRLVDEAHDLVSAGQEPGAPAVRERIDVLVDRARRAGQGEAECVDLFAAAASAMWSDEPDAAERVERLTERAGELGRPPWQATGLAMRASRADRLAEMLLRIRGRDRVTVLA